MGLFGKEDEYIDYTLLKKKGLLRVEEEKAKQRLKTEGGFIDLTAAKTEGTEKPAAIDFGFLGSTTQTAPDSTSAASPLTNFDSITPSLTTLPISAEQEKTDEKELNALKIKVEDIDYKIDRFIERIDRLEEKLSKLGQGNF